MNAYVDPDLCIGCTQCAGLCPAVFHMEGVLAVAEPGPIPPEEVPQAVDASNACPCLPEGSTTTCTCRQHLNCRLSGRQFSFDILFLQITGKNARAPVAVFYAKIPRWVRFCAIL